jgi:hypothetical protein
MGDIKLVKELRLNDESGVVGSQSRVTRGRRMYSAKVMGGETGQMTVAMYQGARVEEVSSHVPGMYFFQWQLLIHCRNGDSISVYTSRFGDLPSFLWYCNVHE